MSSCKSPDGRCVNHLVCNTMDCCVYDEDRKRRNEELERRVEGKKPVQKRVFPTFEEAWKEKEAEGYQYSSDALENVRFGWEIRTEAERKARDRAVPQHLTEGISEEDITDVDRALVKDFYENCCHAEWCEFDEAMLLYAVVRSRLGAKCRS